MAAQYIEYLRKSQMDKDFDELSVEETLKRHQQRLDEFTRQNKINVTVVLKEVVTGESLSGRPEMMKALELINTGEFDGIVCMDLDRLSRGSSLDSGYIMQSLQVNNCKIITPDKIYDLQNESDEQFADMKFMFSRYELRTITKRLVAGRNTSASEGKYVGSVRPYGYEKVKLKGEKGFTLKIIPEEAKIVQMIYDLYTKDKIGYVNIAYTLNRLHIKPLNGGIWTKISVGRILKNELYMGKIRWKHTQQKKKISDGKLTKSRIQNDNYEIHNGLHEAIVSEEQWNLAKQIMEERSIPSHKIGTEIVNPFAGLLQCECGCRMQYRQQKKTERQPRFICIQAGKLCNCKGNIATEIENVVVSEMRTWLNGYVLTLKNDEPNQNNNLEMALSLLQNELDHLHEQQDNICELLEKKVYTVQMFTKRNSVLQNDIDRIQSEIEDLKNQILMKEKDKIVQNQIIPTTQRLLDNYEQLTPREKNDLWKEVLCKIVYWKENRGGEFRITIYPKLNNNISEIQ